MDREQLVDKSGTPEVTRNRGRARIRFVGISCIVFGLLGLLGSSLALVAFLGYAQQDSPPIANHRILMGIIESSICVVIHLILFLVGLKLVQLRMRAYPVFMGLLVAQSLQALYLMSLAILYSVFGPGDVISGIDERTLAESYFLLAYGGLLLELITLFPIWGPFLLEQKDRRLLPRWPLKRPVS